MRKRILTIGVLALMISLSFSALPAMATDELTVDRQDTAVATNLGLFGAEPMDITVDPTNGDYVYAASYTPNGIFHSSDGGETWEGLPSTVDYGAGKHVVVDETTGDVYAVIGDHVIKSTNHGESWSTLTDNMSGHPIMGAVSIFSDNTYMVAVEDGKIQRSTDGGESFTEITIDENVSNSTISLAVGADDTFYAVVQNESTDASTLFRSLDNGSTWNTMAVESAGVEAGSRFYGIFVDPNNLDHLVLTSYHPDYNSYHSLDGGDSWLPLENGEFRIGAEEAVFDGQGRLYIGLWHTDDPDSIAPTWTNIETATPLSSVRADIYAIDQTDPNILFSNSGLGIAKSEDAGASWTDVVTGLTAVKTYAISQAENKDVVWIGANGGLAKTTNFTASKPDWEYPVLPESGISAVKAVWVKPTDSDIVVAGLSGFISISTDGGTMWEHATTPDFLGTVSQIVPSPSDTETLYAIYNNTSLTEDEYNGGVLKSTDGGSTWEELDFPTTLSSSALAVGVSNDTDVLYVGIGSGGSETGVYTYVNNEWSKVEEDFNGLYVNNILVDAEDNSILFVSCEAYSTVGSLFKSTDAGATWEVIQDGLEDVNHIGVMAAQPGNTNTLYLAGQEGGTNQGVIYKSKNGGDSWSTYYVGLKQEFFYTLLFDGLVSGNDRGVFNLKSFGKIVLKKKKVDDAYQFTITLKDAATKKRLANRKIKIYKKMPNKKWRVMQVAKTNAKGNVMITKQSKKNTKFKVIWKPGKRDTEEYIRTTSRVVTIR